MIKIIRCSIDSTFLRVAFDISQLNIRSDNWSVQAFRGSKLLDDAFHKLFTIDVIKPSERIELNYNYSAAVEPVSSIALSIDGSLHVVLDNLFPEDDAEFQRYFIRKVQRTGFAQLDYFVSFQIGKFFIGSPSYICCAQVVKAYKSVEINDPSILNGTDFSLHESYALLEQCKVDWHPRRNKEHLLVSMLCAHWHVKLALGDREGFEDILNRVKSSIDSISNFYTPSYPITLSLLILTIYLAGLNNAEGSKETAKLLVDIFKKAVRDLDPSEVVLFGELAVSHKATLCALQINENKFVMDDSLRKKIISAFRVKGKAADRLCIKFENVLKREELK